MPAFLSKHDFLAMIEEKIVIIKGKCRKNKIIFQTLTACSILLAGAITLTLGFDIPGFNSAQKNIALILGTLLTVLNGWSAIFDYKKLWIRQKSTLLGLYQIENRLKFLTDSESNDEEISKLFHSYQSIWKKDTEEWINIQNTPPNENKKTG